jgi:hypothetical protein
MKPVTWRRHSKSKWISSAGAAILKYRFADRYYFLLYADSNKTEMTDYKRFNTLTEAKNARISTN